MYLGSHLKNQCRYLSFATQYFLDILKILIVQKYRPYDYRYTLTFQKAEIQYNLNITTR